MTATIPSASRATPTASAVPPASAVVLFDGVCNFCNGAVNFIIDRDPRAQFRFAALQSDIAAELLKQRGLVPDSSESSGTILLVEGDRVYHHSTAGLRIARRLRFPWMLSYAFIAVPRPLRDLVYRFIARNRYRWFGKSDACRLPTPELRGRFL